MQTSLSPKESFLSPFWRVLGEGGEGTIQQSTAQLPTVSLQYLFWKIFQFHKNQGTCVHQDDSQKNMALSNICVCGSVVSWTFLSSLTLTSKRFSK